MPKLDARRTLYLKRTGIITLAFVALFGGLTLAFAVFHDKNTVIEAAGPWIAIVGVLGLAKLLWGAVILLFGTEAEVDKFIGAKPPGNDKLPR